jgi:hypothetical protein
VVPHYNDITSTAPAHAAKLLANDSRNFIIDVDNNS